MARSSIEAGNAVVRIRVDNSKALQVLKQTSARFRSTGQRLQGIGAGFAAVGAAGAAALVPAVMKFAEFDDAMRSVQAVTRASTGDFEMLTQTAKNLGATTSFTAAEVGNLMTELGRVGFDPSQINDMTGAVLDLARATGTDATEASGIMAATIRQFGMQAGDATRVADVLTATANKSFTSVTQLGEALSYAGPVAADFGMSVEETAAIIGTLGNVGIQASEAGTTMRRLLMMTGSEAEKMQKIFGVSFVDAAGNARPLIDTLEEVNAATANLGTSDRAAKFNEAFGLLGVTGASSIGKAAGSARELHAALLQAGGTAATTAKEMDAGLGGSMRMLWSAVDGLVIAIGDALDGSLRGLIAKIISAADATRNFITDNKELVTAFAAASAVALALGTGLLTIGTVFTGIGIAIGGIATAVTTLGGIIGAVFSPVGAVLAGVAVVAGIVAAAMVVAAIRSGELGKVWGTITAGVQELLATVRQAMGGIVDAIAAGEWVLAAKIGWAGMRAVWWEGLGMLIEIAQTSGMKLLKTLGNVLLGWVKTAKDAALTVAQILINPLKAGAIMFDLGKSIADAMNGSGGGIQEYVSDQAEAAKADLNRLTEEAAKLRAEREAAADMKTPEGQAVPAEALARLDKLAAAPGELSKQSDPGITAADMKTLEGQGVPADTLAMVAKMAAARGPAANPAAPVAGAPPTAGGVELVGPAPEVNNAAPVVNNAAPVVNNAAPVVNNTVDVQTGGVEVTAGAGEGPASSAAESRSAAAPAAGQGPAQVEIAGDDGDEIGKAIAKPMAKLEAALSGIAAKQQAGELDDRETGLARSAAFDQFAGATATEPPANESAPELGIAYKGSQEAYDSINRSRDLSRDLSLQSQVTQAAAAPIEPVNAMAGDVATANAATAQKSIDTRKLEELGGKQLAALQAQAETFAKIEANTRRQGGDSVI